MFHGEHFSLQIKFPSAFHGLFTTVDKISHGKTPHSGAARNAKHWQPHDWFP